MSDLTVIALDPSAIRELEEIVLEGDEQRALKFLTRVIKPQLEKGQEQGKSFFESEPDPFFEE